MKKLSLLILFIFPFVVISQNLDFASGEVIVMLQPKAKVENTISKINQNFPDLNIEPKEVLSKSLNIQLVGFNPSQHSEAEVSRFFNEYPEVIAAQLNYLQIEYRDSIPNDPSFSQQWAHSAIKSEGAWAKPKSGVTTKGDTIVVAVVDGGAEPHEDLDFFTNRHEIPNNGIDDDNNGYKDDYSGWNVYNNNGNVPSDYHGNHVSGIIGAKGNNDIGVVGVNWNVKILPIAGSSTSQATVVKAYDYAYVMRDLYNRTNGDSGAFVVSTNSSFGRNQADPNNYPIWCAFYDSLGKVGIISAAATANANFDIDAVNDMPTACSSEFMIAVTNTTTSNNKYSGAAYGKTTIDIGAPGTDILSTGQNNSYSNSTGTSMATPQIAGAIALMYNHVCDLMWQEFDGDPEGLARKLKDLLLTEGFDSIPGLKNITVTGGRLNLKKAVASVEQHCTVLSRNELKRSSNESFLVYPNPSEGAVFISTNSNQPINIYSASGKLVEQIIKNNQTETSLNLPNGFYILNQINNGSVITRKLIINK